MGRGTDVFLPVGWPIHVCTHMYTCTVHTCLLTHRHSPHPHLEMLSQDDLTTFMFGVK